MKKMTRRKHNPRLTFANEPTEDVRLCDFADATHAWGRCSKSALPVPLTGYETLPGPSPPPTPVSDHPQREDSSTGNEYPEVLYFLLSRHLHPEDVGRFARINRSAYAATQRAEIWSRLYARVCARREAALPSHLRLQGPHCSARRLYAMRQKVICALHRLHAPFLKYANRWTVQQVVGWACVEYWDRRLENSCWLYCFRFRRPIAKLDNKSPVFVNTQHGCVMLMVECGAQQCVHEACFGLRVTDVKVCLTSATGSSRELRIGLARAPLSRALPRPEVVFTLHEVRSIEVVDWWHRRYPPFRCIPRPFDPTPHDAPPPLYQDFFALTIKDT